MPDTFVTDEPISKETLNQTVRQVERLSQLRGSGPLEVVNTSGGPKIRFVDPTFTAQIVDTVFTPPASSTSSTSSSSLSSSSSSSSTSSTNCPTCCVGKAYSWQEVTPNGDGTWLYVINGRYGGLSIASPAYEINGNCTPVGAIVRMTPGVAGEYLFDWSPACYPVASGGP